jgi:hypothetical protein
MTYRASGTRPVVHEGPGVTFPPRPQESGVAAVPVAQFAIRGEIPVWQKPPTCPGSEPAMQMPSIWSWPQAACMLWLVISGFTNFFFIVQSPFSAATLAPPSSGVKVSI